MKDFFTKITDGWNRAALWVADHPKPSMSTAIIVFVILVILAIR